MSEKLRIGALVIGQSPRPDLVSLISSADPTLEVVEVGALDTKDSILPLPLGPEDYPLTTSLRDGRTVTVPEDLIGDLLQYELDRLELDETVVATVLLCAAPFDSLVGRKPLVKPFDVTLAILRALGVVRVGIVCPYADQEHAATSKWQRLGPGSTIWVKPEHRPLEEWLPERVASEPNIQAVVLDFVGYPEDVVITCTKRLSVPLLDLGRVAAAVVVSLVSEAGTDAEIQVVAEGTHAR